jgi:ABC-type polysaccharide/polyol phosphate transport system ATPase subunit
MHVSDANGLHAPDVNGRPVAVSATDLRKRYQLGELHSLRQTARKVLRRQRTGGDRSFDALAGVSFTVAPGASIGLVGTNGSGKSTLLQILAGTTLPTGGRMFVRGRVLPVLAVGQGFHPELTGFENVTLYATSLGIPRDVITRRMEAVSAFAELEQHMSTPVKRFSSGMISRLSFAIAVQFPADIYIFDEVLAVVDGEFRDRCLREIKGLHVQGRTVFFVSHSLEQVRDVCESVMWLERGRVRQVGRVDELLPAYERALAHLD